MARSAGHFFVGSQRAPVALAVGRRAATCLLLVLLCGADAGKEPGSVKVRDPRACDHFEKGKAAITLHVYEAEGGTRDGVAEGMRELQAALDGGCPKVAEALEMLGDAAWVFASQHAKDGEGPHYAKLALDSRRRYLALRPNDSNVRFDYATNLAGSPEERRQLVELVRRDPRHALGRSRLGRLLVEEGRVGEGAEHLVAAMRLFEPWQADEYGDAIIQLLEKHGRKTQAAAVRKVLSAKRERLPRREP